MGTQSTIESFWYRKSWIRWLFFPLTIPFYLIVQLKRWLYQSGILKSVFSVTPVLVVGNINVGGTGKTPTIQFLVKGFQKKGLKVGIVSRGYQSTIDNFPHEVTKDNIAKEVGDEAFMLFNQCEVPVVIGSDRAQAVRYLESQHQVDIIISDDGLQHYKMARQFELLMVDWSRQFGNELIIPFGPLREPKSRLKSVNAILVNTNSNSVEEISRELLTEMFGVNLNKIGLMQLAPNGWYSVKNNQAVNSDISVNFSNANKKIIAVAGIGNPQRFFNTLSELSIQTEIKAFPDHHAFVEDDFSGLSEQYDAVLMTEKDAVKCAEFAKDNWFYLKVESQVKSLNNEKPSTSNGFEWLFDRISRDIGFSQN